MKSVAELIQQSKMPFIDGVHVVVVQVPEWKADRSIKLSETEEVPVKIIEADSFVEDDDRVFIIQQIKLRSKRRIKDRDLKEIEYHRYQYYNGTPKISDEEYDKLVSKYNEKLAKLAEERAFEETEETENEEA